MEVSKFSQEELEIYQSVEFSSRQEIKIKKYIYPDQFHIDMTFCIQKIFQFHTTRYQFLYYDILLDSLTIP